MWEGRKKNQEIKCFNFLMTESIIIIPLKSGKILENGNLTEVPKDTWKADAISNICQKN